MKPDWPGMVVALLLLGLTACTAPPTSTVVPPTVPPPTPTVSEPLPTLPPLLEGATTFTVYKAAWQAGTGD